MWRNRLISTVPFEIAENLESVSAQVLPLESKLYTWVGLEEHVGYKDVSGAHDQAHPVIVWSASFLTNAVSTL